MKVVESSTKRLPISQFKAHCTEELRGVEETGTIIEITRHGKVIAIARPPETAAPSKTLLGAAKGTAKLNKSYNPHAPAWDPSDWEMNP